MIYNYQITLSREIFDFAQVSIDAVRNDAEHNFLAAPAPLPWA